MSLDYGSNVYLAIFLSPSSAYLSTPLTLSEYPSVSAVGNVGALEYVKLLSIPKSEWERSSDAILSLLKGDTGNIQRVEVQEPKRRAKRGEEL